ncbi:MAG: PQQ-binding-like beta-propeller repeat protein [Ignavibacteria bacterium]|nr:PQQ-binding-like beta-propeller repeat protein [Ignavibacteria bacterium]
MKLFHLLFVQLVFFFALQSCNHANKEKSEINVQSDKKGDSSRIVADSFTVIIGTYLGNKTRNYYGANAPEKLNVIWKHYLGSGRSEGKHGEDKQWFGSGWTGQVLITEEYGKLCLYIGALDHHLKKLNAEFGEMIWQFKFDDGIKGTGSVYVNTKTKKAEEKYSIIQGSKRGYGLSLNAPECYSLRSVSMLNGKELWRYNVRKTSSVSRDVDGTAIIVNDTIIAPLENGYLGFLDANITNSIGKFNTPLEIDLVPLFTGKDHRRNLIAEGSPTVLGYNVYNTCGSGWLFGVDVSSKEHVFKYYVGADLNGTSPVTSDSCLLVTVEREYIPGSGGIYKIDPRKESEDCVLWFFPTGSKSYADWNGGIIGSASVKDNLCVFTGIDGYLYLVDHIKIEPNSSSSSPDLKYQHPKPVLLDRKYIGPTISTPIVVEDKVIACGYSGIYLYWVNSEDKLELLDKLNTGVESTPVVWDHRIYVGSRDGYLYCLGE